MNHLLLPLAFLLMASAAWCAEREAAPIEAVIAEIMAHPNYQQLCGPTMLETKGVRLPVYSRLLARRVGVPPRQLGVLMARRPEAVAALKIDLSNLHPERLAEPDRPLVQPELSERTDQLNVLYLFLVSDLHVIEALPELLQLEERLRGAIQYADEHPKSALPDIAWDGSIFHPSAEKLSVREKFLEFSRVDQRELLSLILRLLREQRFQPVLESRFEKLYRQAGGAAAQADEVNAADADLVVPFRGDATRALIPFNAGVRNEVRQLAEQFLKSVPADQWKRVAS